MRNWQTLVVMMRSGKWFYANGITTCSLETGEVAITFISNDKVVTIPTVEVEKIVLRSGESAPTK